MSEFLYCSEKGFREGDNSEVTWIHYCSGCDDEVHEWSKEINETRRTTLLSQLREGVEGLGHRYPIDIFPELTETDKENLKVVHQMFPNLIGRVDAGACRRQFRIAKEEFSDLIEKAGGE